MEHMSDIQFNPEEQRIPRAAQRDAGKARGLASLLVKAGVVGSSEQANYVILGTALILFLVSIVLFFGVSKDEVVPVPVNEAGQELIPGQIPGEL